MLVQKTTRIDLNRPKKNLVHVSQEDNTQQAKVMLYMDNRPYDVTADTNGATVTMSVAYILPNGYGDQYTTTALGEPAVEQDASIKNLYTINIDGAATDKVGFVELLIKFTAGAGQILHSFPLTLNVHRTRGSDVDPDGGSPATSRYLRKDRQVEATEDMTQPVGVTPEGLLVTAPGGGGGGGGVSDPVRYNTTQNLNQTQQSRARTNIGAGTYSKPSGGIPKSDLASAVQTSLGKADTALQSVGAEDILNAAEDFTAAQQGVMRGYIGAAAATDVSAIAAKIPSEASASNQLADKAWVHAQGGGGGGTVEGAVRYDTSQDINAIQQATARNNIDAEQAGAADAVQTDLNAVKAKIPAAASASNQLADKAWVLQQGGGGGGGTAPQTIIAVVDTSSSPPTVTLTDIAENGLSYSAVQAMVQAGPVTLVVYTDQYHYAGFNWHFATFNGQPYPSTKGLTLFAVIPGSPNPSIYVASLEEDGNGILTGTMTFQTIGAGNAIKETKTTRTAAQMSSGFKVYGNTIYEITGSVAGFAISNGANEKPSDLVEIRLTVGTTAITVPTWPSWATFLNGFDGNLSANTVYDIFINDAGYIWCGTAEVSA